MQYPAIVKLILAKGVDNITIPDNIKFEALTEAASILIKENKPLEAAKALEKANNQADLIRIGEWYKKRARFKAASHFFLLSNDPEKMKSCAFRCLELGYLEEAKRIFEKLNDQAMLSFIEKNT